MSVILIFILSLTGSIYAVPLLSTRYVDLTHTYEETDGDFPNGQKIFKIDKVINETLEDFGGVWYRAEIYRQNSHTGTHMDAPSHWTPDGINVDEMPVSQFCGPAAVIDITQKASLNPDAEVTIEDLLEWESGIGQSLNGSIVLVRTGWEEKYNDRPAYLGISEADPNTLHFPGIDPVACRFLANNRTVKGVGIDTLAVEKGSTLMTNKFACHGELLTKNIFLLEEVAVKKELPLYGAHLVALPQKIKRGSGSPVRIVASFPEIIHNLPQSTVELSN